MEQITSGFAFLAAAAFVLVPTIIWHAPDMLRWLIEKDAAFTRWRYVQMAVRIAQVEAGREAKANERERLMEGVGA